MKYILLFANIAISFRLLAVTVNGMEIPCPFSEYCSKGFVVNAIMELDSEISVLLVEGLETREDRRNASSLLPYYSFFGLKAVKRADDAQISGASTNIVFLYDSGEYHVQSQAAPIYDRSGLLLKGKGYTPGEVFLAHSLRVVFARKVQVPDARKMTPVQRYTAKGARGKAYTYDSIFEEKKINKSSFLSNFSNCVYQVCASGVFAFDSCFTAADENRDKGIAGAGELILLSRRDISEIVYWLLNRDGKASEYHKLSNRNPLLFEPIYGLSSFTTEIGLMLLSRSKN